MPNRPRALELGMATYLVKKRLIKRETRFPVTLMLEPLEICNLACHGCGRIREYEHVFHKRMEVEECLRVAEEAGAPIVNIPGGEPMIHKQIDEIVNGIIAQGRFVYMCTNGLLMNRAFGRIPPSNHFAFVVHLDGMREVHDKAVDREGVFDKATAYMREAIELGYRVCTNTTIYRGVDRRGVRGALPLPEGHGRRGVHHRAGLRLRVGHARPRAVPRQREAQALYSQVHELCDHMDIPFYNNPLFHEFLPGQAQLPLHGVGDAHLHRRGLAQPVLPARRQARRQPQGAVRRAPTGTPTARTATRGARTA